MRGSPSSVPITVSVLYFAALRDLARTHEEQLTLGNESESGPFDVASLLALLQQRHPELTGRLQSVRVAVNEEFVELDAELRGGEVVALIPPVSGG